MGYKYRYKMFSGVGYVEEGSFIEASTLHSLD